MGLMPYYAETGGSHPLLPDFTDNSIVCNKSVALLVQFFSTLKQKQLTPNLCELKPTLHAAKGLGPHSEDHQEIWRKKNSNIHSSSCYLA